MYTEATFFPFARTLSLRQASVRVTDNEDLIKGSEHSAGLVWATEEEDGAERNGGAGKTWVRR